MTSAELEDATLHVTMAMSKMMAGIPLPIVVLSLSVLMLRVIEQSPLDDSEGVLNDLKRELEALAGAVKAGQHLIPSSRWART